MRSFDGADTLAHWSVLFAVIDCPRRQGDSELYIMLFVGVRSTSDCAQIGPEHQTSPGHDIKSCKQARTPLTGYAVNSVSLLCFRDGPAIGRVAALL